MTLIPTDPAVLALDADMLLIRSCLSTEVEIELSDDVWTRHSELPAARRYYWDTVDRWLDEYELERHQVIHCFTERSAFRRELAPTYKLNRKGPKPIGFKALKNELLQEEGAYMHHRIEADDLIGIFATMLCDKAGTQVIIASGDKDLNQIPGHHIWIDKEDWGVTDEEAERFRYQQAISGDTTDGIPGCKGVGTTGAERIVKSFDLADPVGCWEKVVSTYRSKGKDPTPRETALLQARLTRILRHGEYNFKTHEVKLWNPPTA